MTQSPCNVAVIIPTCNRGESLIRTLEAVVRCKPGPAEVLIHIDGGDQKTATALGAVMEKLPIRMIESRTTQGPGGGRNALVHAAKHEILVSLDDDSYPIDESFFSQAEKLASSCADVALFAFNMFERGETRPALGKRVREASSFSGGACMFRRSAFMATAGYVPIQPAYGMEEVDLALQLIDNNQRLVWTDRLRIYHDTDLRDHSRPEVNAAHIRNTALLVQLRYQLLYTALLPLKVLNRIIFACRMRRWRGIVSGVLSIPIYCWRLRKARRAVSVRTLRELRRLQDAPEEVTVDGL